MTQDPWFMYQNRLGPSGGIYYPNFVPCFVVLYLNSKKMISIPFPQVTTVVLHGIRIVCLSMDGKERLCLAQISNTLLKDYSYNEIHNRRVALGITCVQCTPVQVIVEAKEL